MFLFYFEVRALFAYNFELFSKNPKVVFTFLSPSEMVENVVYVFEDEHLFHEEYELC